MTFPTTIPTIFRLARFASGRTQSDIALEAGTYQMRVSRIERGEAAPTTTEAERLAAALGLHPSDLFEKPKP